MAGSLQGDQYLLNLVQFDIVTGQPRNVVGQFISLRPDIGHVMPLGQLPTDRRGRALLANGHEFSYKII
jgi:hypothetical protein